MLVKVNDTQNSPSMEDSIHSYVEDPVQPVIGKEKYPEAVSPPSVAPPSYSAATIAKSQELQLESNTESFDKIEIKKHKEIVSRGMFSGDSGEKSNLSDRGSWWYQLQNYLLCHRAAIGRYILLLTATLIGITYIANMVKNVKGQNKSPSNLYNIQPERVKLPSLEPTYSASGDKKVMKLSFPNPSDFAFHQLVRNSANRYTGSSSHVRINGEIHVKPATQNCESNIQVDVEFRASDPRLVDMASVDQTESGITIETADRFHSSDIKDPSIYITATIWVSPTTHLQTFNIKIHSLSLTFHPGVTFQTATKTTLSTTSGAIEFPPSLALNSRDLIISSSSGSIQGTYPLADLLSITTTSGTITIHLTLQPTLPSNPKPASLHLTTISASITVHTPSIPSHPIPTRDYKTQIHTQTGSITATLLHGSLTTLTNTAGPIHASLHPHTPHASTRSDLRSHTTSGSTHLTLHPSLSHPTAPLRALSAAHHGVSGFVRLTYPSAWEGTIEGKTVSGALEVDWAGTEIVYERKGPVGREIFAMRGDGDGHLAFGGVSGSALLVGGG